MAEDRVTEIDRMIEVVIRSIPKEREARDLYRTTAASSTMELTTKLFQRLAEQEEEHESKLRAVLELLKSERKRQSD